LEECLKFVIFTVLFCHSLFASLIIDGLKDEDGDFKNVFKIDFLAEDKVLHHCTGTIIADRTILTAAHCTDGTREIKNLKIKIQNKTLEIDQLVIPKAYAKLSRDYYESLKAYSEDLNSSEKYSDYNQKHIAVTNYDLALITTKRKISKRFKRTKLNFDKQFPGADVIAVGFGYIDLLQVEFEPGRTRLEYINPRVPYFREEVLANTINNCLEIFSRSRQDYITSSGDSGGPLLLKETSEQIGVLRGATNYISMNGSLYLRLSDYKEFIGKNLKN
jgi:secreted trypsin-like serine protease